MGDVNNFSAFSLNSITSIYLEKQSWQTANVRHLGRVSPAKLFGLARSRQPQEGLKIR